MGVTCSARKAGKSSLELRHASVSFDESCARDAEFPVA